MIAVDFSKAPSCYWSESAKITNLQRRILLHSIMYYGLNVSVISDYDYDKMCYQLVDMQNNASDEECEKSMYWYAFYDFDGHTGFHLSSRLTMEDFEYLKDLAHRVYDYWLKNTTPEERSLVLKGVLELS